MRPATGTVFPERGRWKIRMTVGGKRQRVTGSYATRTEAEAVRAAVLAELEREPAETLTVSAWVTAWLDKREVARVVRTVDGERGLFRAHLETDPLGAIALRKVTRADVLEWTARLRRKGLATQSVRNTLAVLRGALESALDAEQVKANAARGLRLPRQVATEEAWTWLPPADLEKLVAAVDGPERWLVAFAAGSGLRAGELVALRAADVGDDAIAVRYGGPPSEPTKSGRIRRVPLLPLAREAWDRWRAAREAWAHKGDGKRNPLGLAFPGRRGGFRNADHVLRWDQWNPARVAAGLPDVRWHDLRHTCASSLVSGVWGRSWSLEEVKEVLGHSDIAVTQRYAHLSHDAIAEAARATPGRVRHRDVKPGDGDPIVRQSSAPLLACAGFINDSTAPPAGIGPATFGLGNRCAGEWLRGLDPQGGRIADVCRALVGAAELGEDPRAHLAALRVAFVDIEADVSRTVAATLERLGGPFALMEGLRISAEVLGVETRPWAKAPRARARLGPEMRARIGELLGEGLTQREVAERLGVAQATVSRVGGGA